MSAASFSSTMRMSAVDVVLCVLAALMLGRYGGS
jgi:hypothetical protein